MYRPLLPLALVVAGALAACGGYGQPSNATSQLAFGSSMAQRGLWREALFRFSEAERLDPENPRVQNNLGVAYEATGDFDRALAHYQHALKLAPNSREVKNNYARFVEFYQSFRPKAGKDAKAAVGTMPKLGGTHPAAAPPRAGSGTGGTGDEGPGVAPPDQPGPLPGEGPEPQGPEPIPPPPPPV
jgi:Tetratricopeptide repeat